MEKKFQADARWSCRSCGDCCRGFSFGPVAPQVVQNLKEKKIEEHWPAAQGGWYIQNPNDGSFFFQHRDGHCVFLQDDNLCAIHARFGSEAKPWFCREYPFHVVEDKQGVSVTVREDCGGFHKSFADGERISEQLDSILEIQRVVPRQRFDPERLIILPGLAVSVDNWLQVEPVLIARCEDNAKASISGIRTALFQMAGRQGPPPNEEAYQETYQACRSFLLAQLQQLDVAPIMQPSLVELKTLLSGDTVQKNLTEECESYFLNILRNRLLSKSFARLGGLPMGLGLFLFERELMRALAEDGSVASVGLQMSSWRRRILLRPVWQTIRKLTPKFLDLFMYA